MNSVVARRIPYFLLATLAFVLALVPLRPSPEASVQNHNFWLLKWWLPSIAPLSIAIVRKWPGRGPVLITAVLLYFAVFLARPVCDEIPLSIQSNFETSQTLERRAQLGEPFRRLDGRWYQCKSWLSRQFFF